MRIDEGIYPDFVSQFVIVQIASQSCCMLLKLKQKWTISY